MIQRRSTQGCCDAGQWSNTVPRWSEKWRLPEPGQAHIQAQQADACWGLLNQKRHPDFRKNSVNNCCHTAFSSTQTDVGNKKVCFMCEGKSTADCSHLHEIRSLANWREHDHRQGDKAGTASESVALAFCKCHNPRNCGTN